MYMYVSIYMYVNSKSMNVNSKSMNYTEKAMKCVL